MVETYAGRLPHNRCSVKRAQQLKKRKKSLFLDFERKTGKRRKRTKFLRPLNHIGASE